jgi:RNA polymerase-binding transcription factor DksA
MNSLSDDSGRTARAGLLARAAELRDRLQRVRSDLKREREPLPRDSDDAAIALENDEVLDAIERSSSRELELVDAALTRIEQGTYGLCESCAGEIDSGRLQAVPYVARCRACAAEE